MLTWETLDLEAAYPETVHRAAGTECEYRIAHYRQATDRKKFDRGPHDNWTVSTDRISFASYHESLDAAKAAAANWEARINCLIRPKDSPGVIAGGYSVPWPADRLGLGDRDVVSSVLGRQRQRERRLTCLDECGQRDRSAWVNAQASRCPSVSPLERIKFPHLCCAAADSLNERTCHRYVKSPAIRPQLAKAREIAEKAEAENRTMTPEEQTTYEEIMAKGREVADAVKAYRHDLEVFAFARELSDNVIGPLNGGELSGSSPRPSRADFRSRASAPRSPPRCSTRSARRPWLLRLWSHILSVTPPAGDT